MPRLVWDKAFKKKLDKKVKVGGKEALRIKESLKLLCEDPYTPKLKLHKLSGILQGLWAVSCGYDCRIIIAFLDNSKVLLIDIGTHDEVY